MSNKRYDFQENSYYHVYNRGFLKQPIFIEEKDYERFCEYVIKEQKNYNWIKLISYSFLPNHFHFIIHNIKTGLDISDFMRKIQVSYTMYFKLRYKETGLVQRGPFFEWRFKAKLIKDEDYLLKCIAYVNYNPLKHKIIKDIDNYKYTSLHQLIGSSKPVTSLKLELTQVNTDFLQFKDIELEDFEF